MGNGFPSNRRTQIHDSQYPPRPYGSRERRTSPTAGLQHRAVVNEVLLNYSVNTQGLYSRPETIRCESCRTPLLSTVIE